MQVCYNIASEFDPILARVLFLAPQHFKKVVIHMNEVFWVFLLIIGLIVLGVVIYRTAKKGDDYTALVEEATKKATDPTLKISPRPSHSRNEPVATQTTIYEYQPNNSMQLCQTCDGENLRGSSRCRICGRRFY